MTKLTEGLVKEIGEWIKFYLEHVTEREWVIEIRWEHWDVSYRISLETSDFVHITGFWDNVRDRHQNPREYALQQVSSLLFRFSRYEKMESLGIIDGTERLSAEDLRKMIILSVDDWVKAKLQAYADTQESG